MGIGESGRGSNGGVWEWTSTVLEDHDGLVPTKLFPGYSAFSLGDVVLCADSLKIYYGLL